MKSENKDNKKKQNKGKKTESDTQNKCKRLRGLPKSKLWKDKFNLIRFKNKEMNSTKEN